MKEIPLTQGKHAYVDDGDYAVPSRYSWRWTPAGAATTMSGTPVLLHRFILQPPEGTDVVFLNSKKWDCRRENMHLIDHGLAQWVDRNVYGFNSLVPLIARLEVAERDFTKTPESLEDAVELRSMIQQSINQCTTALADKELTKDVPWDDVKRWRREIMRVMRLRTEQRDRVKVWYVNYHGHKKRTDDERIVAKNERFEKFQARQLATASLLADNDPYALLLRLHTFLSQIDHEGRVKYTDDERILIDAVSDAIKDGAYLNQEPA